MLLSICTIFRRNLIAVVQPTPTHNFLISHSKRKQSETSASILINAEYFTNENLDLVN